MKALITGGAGFIGSHLAEALLQRGDAVTLLDDLSTGNRDNLAALSPADRVRFLQGSITDAATVDQLVADADVVYHLASAVGVQLIIDQPVKTIETIVTGTDIVLQAAAKHRRPVLITSSSEVYGKGSRIPFAEDDDVVLGPTSTRRWSYACSKMLDEFLALAHWHASRLPVVIVRLFNTVGPGQTGAYGMVLPRFVGRALRGEAIRVYGDGEQTRCFCHVGDVVDALAALMACEQARGQVVNIGSDQEVSINALAKRVIDVAGSASRIEHVPYDEAYIEGFEDMRRRVPSLQRAKQLIGYAPTRSLDEIIRSVIEAMQ